MIEATDLRKRFHTGDEDVEALRGLSFTIDDGSFTFFVGPSGAGKSTLLYLIGLLDRPTSGTIRLNGDEITAMTEDQLDHYRRDQIGFVFQQYDLIPNLSSIENVLLPYIPVGVTPEQRTRAEALLDRVGLGDRKNHRPRQLSGGQQQRVAIARALIKDPKLLLADEPTGNLDRAGGDSIFDLIRSEQTRLGCTVIVVTHDRRFIRPDDQILEIEDGQLAHA